MDMSETTRMRVEESVITHFHLFCGSGGGAIGFARGNARVGNLKARFECLGGIDIDAGAIADFNRRVGVPGTVMDLATREQYIAINGAEPPASWKEATAADVRRAAGGKYPNVIFLSAPCKGFSGLLGSTMAATAKYQALNELTIRGIWLTMEAFAEDPPELLVFENVPRIQSGGRHLLDQIKGVLGAYGYAVAETTHDCGEIGGMAQHRRRMLLVARHMEKVPPFLYEPPKRQLQSIGTLLDRTPLPGDPAAGPMHRVPRLAWKTWMRLAFVETGSDWRSLNRLAVNDGMLADYHLVRQHHEAMQVADMRFAPSARWNDGQAYGVRHWNETTGTVAGQTGPGQGAYSVADPRHFGTAKHSNECRIRRYTEASGTVTGAHGTGQCLADPRMALSQEPDMGVFEIAHGPTSLSGPDRGEAIGQMQKGVAMIRSLDGCWHRPFTTFELAVLQSYIEPDGHLEMEGSSDTAHRERIGNMVPPAAAEAIASVMGHTILLARTGETFVLSSTPIWVRPTAIALSVATAPLM